MGKRKITVNLKDDEGNSLRKFSFTVRDGDSAYEQWLKEPGNKGKSIEDYFESIKYKGE